MSCANDQKVPSSILHIGDLDAELKKKKRNFAQLSWRHLPTATAIKNCQIHLMQQSKPSNTLDAAATTQTLAITIISFVRKSIDCLRTSHVRKIEQLFRMHNEPNDIRTQDFSEDPMPRGHIVSQ
ncbi:hypothetical protein TNCV_4883511 [Trichonephila clavipes]|nr:hypothetical protein TNCV_4883511 [Trichonephila clavipes]